MYMHSGQIDLEADTEELTDSESEISESSLELENHLFQSDSDQSSTLYYSLLSLIWTPMIQNMDHQDQNLWQCLYQM